MANSPCTGILDNFNRPNEGPPPGANWSNIGVFGGYVVDTNVMVPDAVTGVTFWRTSYGPNCETWFTVVMSAVDGDNQNCYIRTDSGLNTGYVLTILYHPAGSTMELQVVGPGTTLIDYGPVDLGPTPRFWIKACGSTLSLYLWSDIFGRYDLLGVAVDATYPNAGYLGFYGKMGIDDFGGGDLSDDCECIIPPAPPYGVPSVRTPSFYQQTGLTIVATDPLLAATRSTWFSRLSDQVQTFRMEKRRIGGYWSAGANINMRLDEVEDWVGLGLGRHVQVIDEALCVVWEGFVNRIEARLGKLTFTLGPLMDVANRVQVAYSTIDNTVSPPIMGNPARTTAVNDLDSQAIYGIIQKILNTGGSTPAEAAQNGNAYLALNAWPPTGRKSTLLGGAAGDLTIEMLGYWAWLGAYVYNQTAATGSTNASAKLQAVLAAQPNAGLFSTDYARITANTVQISQWEDEDRTGEDVVKAINALGTTTYATTNIGFYNGRQLVYEPAPTSIRYVQRVTGNDLLTDLIGGRVQPWNVMPGEWIFYADFLAGRLPPVTGAAIQRDPRCGLIEVVTLDNRYGLDINGIHVGTLDQMLARQGLAGVGA